VELAEGLFDLAGPGADGGRLGAGAVAPAGEAGHLVAVCRADRAEQAAGGVEAGREVVGDPCCTGRGSDDVVVGGQEFVDVPVGGGRVGVGGVVVFGHEAGRDEQAPAGGGGADGFAVFGGDDGQGVGGVVDSGEDGGEAGGGEGEVGGVAQVRGVAAGGCPVRVGVREPSGPQGDVADFGGDRGVGGAFFGGDGVEGVRGGAPGRSCGGGGIGRVPERGWDGGGDAQAPGAVGERAQDELGAVAGDGGAVRGALPAGGGGGGGRVGAGGDGGCQVAQPFSGRLGAGAQGEDGFAGVGPAAGRRGVGGDGA